jgi:hypothetical protein
VLTTAIVTCGVGVLVLMKTEWGHARLLELAVARVAPLVDGTLTIGRIDGSLTHDLVLQDVRILRAGVPVLEARRVALRYHWATFVRPAIVLSDVVLDGAQVTVARGERGWQVDGIRMPPSAPAPDAPTGRTFDIATLTVTDSQITLTPSPASTYVAEVQSARAALSVRDHVTVSVREIVGRERTGGLSVERGAAVVTVDDESVRVTDVVVQSPASHVEGHVTQLADGRLDGAFRSRGLLVSEVAPYVPSLAGYTWRPAFDVTLAGPAESLAIAGTVTDPVAGHIAGRVVVRAGDRVHLTGETRVRDLNLEPLLRRSDMVTRLTGEVAFAVALTDHRSIPFDGTFSARLGASSYTYVPGERYDIVSGTTRGEVREGRVRADVTARAYDAETTGTLTWESATEVFRMAGRLQGGRLDRVPAFLDAPPFDAEFNGAYVLTVDPASVHVVGTLAESTIEGARLDAGTVLDVTVVDDDVTYRVSGRATDVAPWRWLPPLEVELDPTIRAHQVRLDTTFEVAGGGPIAEPFDHDFTFRGRMSTAHVDEAVFRDVPFDGAMAARRLAVRAHGEAAGDWARLLGDPEARWHPTGRFDATLGISDVSADTYTLAMLNGVLTVDLESSILRDVPVRNAQITAALERSLVSVTRGDVTMDAGTATFNGTLAGDEGLASAFVFRGVFSDLAALPPTLITGLRGAATIDGRVTGPWSDTTVNATITGTTLVVEDVRIGSAGATVAVTIPGMDTAKVTGTMNAEAALIEVGSQRVTRATATAAFTADTADITSVITHERGTLSTQGRVGIDVDDVVTFEPTSLDLSLPGATWTLAEDVRPRLRWLADRVDVQSLAVRHGDARVFATGSLGVDTVLPGEGLRVSAERVDVGPFAELMLGTPRVTGRLDASTRVTGSLAALTSSSTFTLANGTADAVPFRAFGGSVTTGAESARVDLTLDAAERGTASLVGTVPFDAAGSMDVRVEAALADVGVVGPAIPYVANAAGSAATNLRITGTWTEPVVNGSASMTDVRFAVPETGVSYRGMQVEVAAVDSILQVRRFTVEDPQGHVLRVNGRLDVLEALQKRGSEAGGDVDLRVVARDFRILGNSFGELSVNLNLTAVGTLVAPQVLGAVTVERGRFEVDRLLETFVQPYTATAGLEVRQHADAPAPPHVFSGAAFSIDLQLPDNVVVRGRGIQTEDGPIGLGDINLTLGGTLQVVKRAGSDASLVGEVNAVRGTYDFQGRRFAIQRGSRLRFRGDDYTDPSLEITALREIQGVRVTALLTGTAMEPELTLRSDPPLDEGDILALIVFNRPINELAEAQKVSLASRAGAMAAGVLVGPIADSVARALDLDVFEIQTAAEGTGGPIVTVGRQVSDRLFVGFRHEFGTEGSNRLTFEYRLTEFLRIVTSVAQGGDPASRSSRAEAAGIDLIFVIRR